MRAENSALDQIESIDLERQALIANAQRGLPTALVLMFSMAEGSTKILEEESDLGWFIVQLDEIDTDISNVEEELLDNTQAQFELALAAEYNAQLVRAIREEVGIERNEEAIEELRNTLAGAN